MRTLWLSCLLTVAFVGGIGILAPWAAGAHAAQGNFDIRVYVCSRDPGEVSYWMGGDPDGCQRMDGVTVSASTRDGESLGSCTTGEDRQGGGECSVVVRDTDRVVVTEDVATLPPGYRPRENPTVTAVYGEWYATVFVNIPTDEEAVDRVPEGPIRPATLPNTGAGPAPDTANAAPLVAAIIALVAALALGRAASSSAP